MEQIAHLFKHNEYLKLPYERDQNDQVAFCCKTYASAIAIGSFFWLCFFLLFTFSFLSHLFPMQVFCYLHCSLLLFLKAFHFLFLLLPLKPCVSIRPNWKLKRSNKHSRPTQSTLNYNRSIMTTFLLYITHKDSWQKTSRELSGGSLRINLTQLEI